MNMTGLNEMWVSQTPFHIYYYLGVIVICYVCFVLYKKFTTKQPEAKYPNSNKPSYSDKLNEIINVDPTQQTQKDIESELVYIDEQIRSKVMDFERLKKDIETDTIKINNTRLTIKRLVRDKQMLELQIKKEVRD